MPYEHFRTEHPAARHGDGADADYPAFRPDRLHLARRARVSERRQPDHFGQLFLSGGQCRRDREPDYRAARAEYQRYSGHSLAVERQQAGVEPHHGRVRAFGRSGDGGQRRTRQGVARAALSAARLRSSYRVEGRRRCVAYSDGDHPERQAVAARAERDRRSDGQGAVADDRRREQRRDMGREALLDAPVARSRQDGRLRHHARRREKRARPRERRASLGQHRGQYDRADDPYAGPDAYGSGVQ